MDIHSYSGSNNTITTKLATPLLFLQELGGILFDLRWWILLAFVLILSDLWFGLRASKKRGVEIRKSSAGRRTINKAVDYLLYIVIGTTIGMALSQSYGINPMIISCTILAFCYAFEIDSIYGHICYLHGTKKVISIWKAIWLIITFRFSELRDIDKLKPISKTKKIKTNGN